MLWLKSSSRFAKLQLYYKYIFNMAIIKTVEGENSSMGKEKPDRYIQDRILIAIDTDKEYLSDNMAFINKDI